MPDIILVSWLETTVFYIRYLKYFDMAVPLKYPSVLVIFLLLV